MRRKSGEIEVRKRAGDRGMKSESREMMKGEGFRLTACWDCSELPLHLPGTI